MIKRNQPLQWVFSLGLALAGPLCTANTATDLPTAITSGCGVTIPVANLISGGQLDLSSLPPNSSVVYLLDQQGNILTSIDVSGSDLSDITPYETAASSIYIPCENSAQADRRIIVYQS